MEIRSASADDLPAIASVSRAAGQQPPKDSGASPHYVELLLVRGSVMVATASPVGVVGWGAVRPVLGASMLTDLFVDPAWRGVGIGSALLSALWPAPAGPRFTFSSQDPRALPLYVRTGLQASWPLLYLSGDPDLPAPAPRLLLSEASPAEAAEFEASITRTDRRPDYDYWATAGQTVLTLSADGHAAAAGAFSSAAVTHLAVADGQLAADALLAVVRTAGASQADAGSAAGGTATGGTAAGGAVIGGTAGLGPVAAAATGPAGGAAAARASTVRVCLPGPHPALRSLLDAGFRVDGYDIHMCTPGLELPVTWAYSPSLA